MFKIYFSIFLVKIMYGTILASDSSPTVVSSSRWNYDTLGPDFWKVGFSTSCGNGQSQSPINIISAATAYDSTLARIQFYNYNKVLTWNITNNGHTIVSTKQDSNAVPYIKGSNYGKTFYLVQFHFHWGFNDYQGSEHLIDYQKYPLELHLVHKSDDSTLAVVGFLFQLSESNNTELEPILDAAIYGSVTNRSTLVEFNLYTIIPSATSRITNGYYRYAGSSTTPPCTEGVIWTVYNVEISISSHQLEVFRNNSVLTNFRDTQQLYNRLVYRSFNSHSNSLLKSDYYTLFLIFFFHINYIL